MSIDKDLLDRLMEGRSAGDLFGKEGILSELTKALAERALTTELEEHPGEERAEAAPEGHNHPPDRRNGSSRKTVTTESGKVVLDIPRDRNATFDPLLTPAYQRHFPEFDRKIVSMYARGMTTREIQGHIEEIDGFEASPRPDLRCHRGRDGVQAGPRQRIKRSGGSFDGAERHRLAEPPAGAVLSGGLHGRDPGQYPQRWRGVEQGGLRGAGDPARWHTRCSGPLGPGQRGRQVLDQGAEQPAKSRRPGHPPRRGRRPQRLPPGDRRGLSPDPGPDLRSASVSNRWRPMPHSTCCATP